MKIVVNDEVKEIQERQSVFDFLESLEMDTHQGIALAINQEIIPKTQWKAVYLKENDSVLVVRPIQGG